MAGFKPPPWAINEAELEGGFKPPEYAEADASAPASMKGWSVRRAAPGESERLQSALEMPSTRRDRASDFSVAESALFGGGEGTTLGFGDELGAAITAPFSSPSEQQKRDWADTGAKPSFKEWLVANYEKERSQGRRSRDMAADQNPAEYGLGNVAGGFATGVVLDGLTGGAASTPLGNAAQGTLTGIGSSDAPLFSADTALAGGLGGALGGAFGKAAKVAPVKASLVGAGLGGAAALFGDKIGMSKADRVGAGIGGGLAAGAAAIQGAAKAGNFLGKKSGQIADEARGVVQKGLEAADVVATKSLDKESAASKAAGLKLFDKVDARLTAENQVPEESVKAINSMHKAAFKKQRGDEKILHRAMRKAGKDKMARFEEAIEGTNKQRVSAEAEGDNAAVAALQRTEYEAGNAAELQNRNDEALAKFNTDAESASDDALVDAFQRSEARAIKNAAAEATAEGSDPRAKALSELGHKAKEFYARVRTQLGMGADLDADTLDALKILQPDFETQTRDLAGEFKGGKAALMERLVAKYEADAARAAGQRNDLTPIPDTVVNVPSASSLAAARPPPRQRDVPRPDTEIGVPSAEMLGAAQKPPEGPRSRVPRQEQMELAESERLLDYNNYEKPGLDHWNNEGHTPREERARLKAVKKLLGLEELEPGETPDPASFIVPDSDEQGRIAEGAGVRHLVDTADDRADRAMAKRAREVLAGVVVDDIPGNKTPIEGPNGSNKPRSLRLIDDSLDPQDRLIDYAGWPRWSQTSSPDAPLVPEAQVGQYFRGENFNDLPQAREFGGQPKSGRPVGDIDQMLMDGRVNEKVDAAKIRPSPTNAVRALVNPKGAAVGALSSLVSGGDPAAKAKLYSAAQRALSTDPLLQEKYGALFANATVRADLPAILAAFPDLAKAVMAAASQEEQ